MTIREFQQFIRDKYYATDLARGTSGTFMWFVEEVGELASALAGIFGFIRPGLRLLAST